MFQQKTTARTRAASQTLQDKLEIKEPTKDQAKKVSAKRDADNSRQETIDSRGVISIDSSRSKRQQEGSNIRKQLTAEI